MARITVVTRDQISERRSTMSDYRQRGSQKPKRLSNFIHGIERMPARSTPVG